MKKLTALLLALALTLGLAACADRDEPAATTPPPPLPTSLAEGGTRSNLRVLYGTEADSLHYLRDTGAASLELSANLVDCLVEYDNYGRLIPSLAESWESNGDASEWTFYIRPGVQWVDADGNAVADVTAQDWVSAAAYVLEYATFCAATAAKYDGVVKNAAEYYAQTAAVYGAETAVGLGAYPDLDAYYEEHEIDPSELTLTMRNVGVTAADDLTLVYTLAEPCAFFPALLSDPAYMPVYGPFLEEQGEDFGGGNRALLYNGAFLLTEFEPGNHRALIKNPAYWDAENVYIEEMEWLYHADAAAVAPDFFRNDVIDHAALSGDTADAWRSDPATAGMVSPVRTYADVSWFYVFNFEPRYDAAYNPEDWTIAVNNENFRQAVRAGLDRVNALSVHAPYDPAVLLRNTVTPATFAAGIGKDYTRYAPLLPFTDSDSFSEAAALNYRDLAIDELTAAGCGFPVKMFMPFDSADPAQGEEYRAIEEQLEELLGGDFLDVIVEEGQTDGFSAAYSLIKRDYRADYADPLAWTEPFALHNLYNYMYTNADTIIHSLPVTNKSADTQATVSRYYDLVAAAGQTVDLDARYEAFAKAEAYLLDHALVIPFSAPDEGDCATRLNPFEGQYSPCGLARLRYKGMHVYNTPVSAEIYYTNLARWQTARAAALALAR